MVRIKNDDWLLVGAGATVLYLLWKAKDDIKKGIENVSDAFAIPISSTIIEHTLPGAIKLTGTAVLQPSGYRIAMSDLNIEPDTLTFYFTGIKYRIVRREGDNYIAERA